MTRTEYQNIRDLIETRYREAMAALETLWGALNGSNAPGGIVDTHSNGNGDEIYGGEGLRSALSIGVAPAGPINGMHRKYKRRGSGKELSDEETVARKARKAAYMKAYMAKRKAAAA